MNSEQQTAADSDLPDWLRPTPHAHVQLWDRTLELLPGTIYQRYLLPLEYAPSRDLRPRWGASRPAHPGLLMLLRRDEHLLRRMVIELKDYYPYFQRIDLKLDPQSDRPGWDGGSTNPMDLAFLYFFVAKFRPGQYVEIGSGQSTRFARQAVTDHNLGTRIISIDPEPRNTVTRVCDEIIPEGLETLQSLRIFDSLDAGDIVFLDGSHRAFMNSDVTVFMIDILPRLKPGVLIHIHDISWPHDYPEGFRHWYWNEQYLLATWLLAAPEKVQVLLPAAYIETLPDLVAELTPPAGMESIQVGWQHGGSFWFTKV